MDAEAAGQVPRRRPDLNTLWHDWKQEDYMSSTTGQNTYQASWNLTGAFQESNPLVTPLARLPPELLEIVLGFLPPNAELSFRLSYPKLHRKCGSQSVANLLFKADPNMRQSSRWIYYTWIEQYRRKRSLITLLSCFLCLTRHPRSSFSEHEAAKTSGKRSCLGWTRRLHVSPHDWISLEHIFEARRKEGDVSYQNHTCTLTTIDDTAEERRRSLGAIQDLGPSVPEVDLIWPSSRHPSLSIDYFFHPFLLSYKIRFHIPLLLTHKLRFHTPRYLFNAPLPPSLKKIFGKNPYKFCPHMDSDDLTIGRLVRKRLESRYAQLCCKVCETKVSVDLTTNLDFHVTKVIGDLYSALDRTWLAHLS